MNYDNIVTILLLIEVVLIFITFQIKNRTTFSIFIAIDCVAVLGTTGFMLFRDAQSDSPVLSILSWIVAYVILKWILKTKPAQKVFSCLKNKIDKNLNL